jgi:hypothetical protein
MKNKLKELDVDFIGTQNQPITKEEELAISAFLKANKGKMRLETGHKTKGKVIKRPFQPA